jgi:hypothetical protein
VDARAGYPRPTISKSCCSSAPDLRARVTSGFCERRYGRTKSFGLGSRVPVGDFAARIHAILGHWKDLLSCGFVAGIQLSYRLSARQDGLDRRLRRHVTRCATLAAVALIRAFRRRSSRPQRQHLSRRPGTVGVDSRPPKLSAPGQPPPTFRGCQHPSVAGSPDLSFPRPECH